MTSSMNYRMRKEENSQMEDGGLTPRPKRSQNGWNFDVNAQRRRTSKERKKLRRYEEKRETGWSVEWLAESRSGPVVTSSYGVGKLGPS